MKTVYYDLKSVDSLPPGSSFVDPFDKEVFFPTARESLSEFINRITDSRAKKEINPIVGDQLRLLIVESLHDTTDPALRQKFFNEKEAPLSMVQVLGFARAVNAALKDPKAVSIKTRQMRARHCLSGCTLHQSPRQEFVPVKKLDAPTPASAKISRPSRVKQSFKHRVVTWVGKLIGVQDSMTFEGEDKLGACRACGCGLAGKIQWPTEAVIAGLDPTQIDEILVQYRSLSFRKCWMLEEGLSSPRFYELLKKKLSHTNQNGLSHLQAFEMLKQQEALNGNGEEK